MFRRSWAGALVGVPPCAMVVIDDWGLHINGVGSCSLAWEETCLELRRDRRVAILGPFGQCVHLHAFWFSHGRRAIQLIADRVEFTRL